MAIGSHGWDCRGKYFLKNSRNFESEMRILTPAVPNLGSKKKNGSQLRQKPWQIQVFFAKTLEW